MAKRRADVLVVEQGLAETRSRAQALILAGSILRGDVPVQKAGDMLPDTAELRLRDQPIPYVSRGGLKLEAALCTLNVDVRDRVCLDIGQSTGGFTDCLLQRGARKVYGVDVGYGQLAWSLREDARVVALERQNIRDMPADAIPELCSVIAIDVSFISLRLVVPPALRFASRDAVVVALVKPQFEVGREHVGKGGIVRDEAARARALADATALFADLGLLRARSMESPIVGAKGNREYLLVGERASG